MALYKLTQYKEAGFASNTYNLGIWATRELAEARAAQLEPNKEIRDYEFHIYEVEVQDKLPEMVTKD